MRAIILSAGQGRRLLPLTEKTPKCLLPVRDDLSVLEFQLATLAACGVTYASVMVGFGADQVEEHIERIRLPGLEVRTVFNPMYALSDNLVTAWLARAEMKTDFLLLNGDTLFEIAVLRQLLASSHAPLTLAIDQKDEYDDDDMKVQISGSRKLTAIGKTLATDVRGESIGLMLFRGAGVQAFRGALEAAVREPEAVKLWYLSVVNGLVGSMPIEVTSIKGLWWGEIDCAADLAAVRGALAHRAPPRPLSSQLSRHPG